MKQERKELVVSFSSLLECGDTDKHFLVCVTGDETWVWNYALKLSS